MKDIFGFVALSSMILLTLFLVWYGLSRYSQSQPAATYQTALVKELVNESQKAPLLWTEESSEYQWRRMKFGAHEKNDQQLTELFKNAPNKRVLLFFSLATPKALPMLRTLFLQDDRWRNTIFCSRADGLLKDLRRLEPHWSFCSGEIFMTRLLALSSLKLGKMLDFSADVFFIHLDNMKASKSLGPLIEMAQSQNKLVLIGPSPRPLEGIDPNGWMVQ